MTDIATLEATVKDLQERVQRMELPPTNSPDAIFSFLEKEFKLTRDVIISREQAYSVARVRHIAYWILYNLEELNLMQIGNMFNRKHTTVLSGIESMNDILYFERLPNGKTKFSETIERWKHSVERNNVETNIVK